MINSRSTKIQYTNKIKPSLVDEKDIKTFYQYKSSIFSGKADAIITKVKNRGRPAPIISTDIMSVYTAECAMCDEIATVSYMNKLKVKAAIKRFKEIYWHARIIEKAPHRWRNDRIEWYCPNCADEVKFKYILL